MAKLNTKELIKIMRGKSIAQLKKTVCGEQIGYGLYRDVYVLKQNPSYVVKIERDMSTGAFANVCEWRNYIDLKDWKWFSEWMSPCELINQTGQVLIQRRTTAGKRKDYPKHIPAFFTDTKLSNFGWIGDRFVCHDYSSLLCVSKTKMKYVKWWGTLKDNKI